MHAAMQKKVSETAQAMQYAVDDSEQQRTARPIT